MPNIDIRPETVQVTEQAAWAQIQKLQNAAFEKAGLPGVLKLTEFIGQRYDELKGAGETLGKSELLARGVTAAVLITDLLPEIEQKMIRKAANSA